MPRKVKQPHGGSITLAEKGDVLNPRGPVRKVLSQLVIEAKANGYERATASTVLDLVETLMGMDEEGVKAWASDPDGPYLARILAIHWNNRKDRLALTMSMLDRAHGKAKQQVDLSGAGAIPVPAVTVVVQAVTPNGG